MPAKEKEQKGSMSKDEQIGFHKGSLSTLAKERQEFMKTLSIVEQLMQMHIKALQELGVDLTKEAQAAVPEKKEKKPPIDEML
ncbi:MAG: hypothetical protein NTZ02_01325 [Candidatus Woesearchaeota archaeon]|jgi:hypothetical protein|nr:hypothetical protein [Candidatus Woesearchaeota archaeon]